MPVARRARSETSAEAAAKVVRSWLTQVGAQDLVYRTRPLLRVRLLRIRQWETRGELLNGEIFYGLKGAKLSSSNGESTTTPSDHNQQLNDWLPARQSFETFTRRLAEMMPMQ